jgi:hypothetical protein
MLSFTSGTPIARVKGGRLDGKTIYLDENATDFGSLKDPPHMKKNLKPDLFESLGSDFFEKKTNKKLKTREIMALKKRLKNYDDYNSDEEEQSLSDEEDYPVKGEYKKKMSGKHPQLKRVAKMAKKMMNSLIGREIHINDGHIQPVDTGKHTNMLACGPSGSGKSTVVSNMAKEWLKTNRGGKIIIFSRLDQDEVLDKLNPTRIKINEELLDNPINFEELSDCFVIFDDTDTIQDKNLAKYIAKLRDDLAQCGRHHNITMATTSHHIMNYRATRDMLMEATCIVVYPRLGGSAEIEGYCKKYMSLKKEQIEKIMNLPSRWVLLSKCYPYYCIYDSGVYLL